MLLFFMAATAHAVAPTAQISSPASNSRYASGSYVTFTGIGTDEEDGNLSGAALTWTSSIDGPLGVTGANITINTLSNGTHLITLTVTDTEGLSDTDSITVMIGNALPTASITSPSDGSTYEKGQSVVFRGAATDVEDPIGELSFEWASSLDGVIGTGTSVARDNLTTGSHVITLTVTDSDGGVGIATIVVHVKNAVPVVEITNPSNGSWAYVGDSVELVGQAFDDEDGEITGTNLEWRSSIDGVLGTGNSLILNSLTEGTHTFTLYATDNDGAVGKATLSFRVGNLSPVVTIDSPANESAYDKNALVIFEATVTDVEDEIVNEAHIVWISSIDGQIGVGTSFSRDNLSIGTHIITLTATDSQGASTFTTIFVTITNHAPEVSIISPADNSIYNEGANVDFSGAARDQEDGELTGASLVWTSNRDGQIGTGTTFVKNNLSRGEHQISLTATDVDGAKTTVTLTLIIGNTPPTARILSPVNLNRIYYHGDYIVFEGEGEDAEDGTLTGASLVWSSSRDGQLGTGNQITTHTLTPARHTITLTVTDSNGATATDMITIQVGNTAPTGRISRPLDNSVFDPGAYIEFIGSGRDLEDGELTGSSLSWSSSRDGHLGEGETLYVDDLSRGTHIITLTLTDKDRDTATDFITLTIRNQAPTAEINHPQTGAAYYAGDLITFSGTGADPDEGNLSQHNLLWESSLDGEIGIGKTVVTTTLSLGSHVITLTATDHDHVSAATTIIVNILAPEDLTVTPETLILSKDTSESLTISGGMPPYEIFIKPPYPVFDLIQVDRETRGPRLLVTALHTEGSVALTLTDRNGDGTGFTVTVVGTPATADAGDNQAVTEGRTVILDAGGSTPGDSEITGYRWEQVDGPKVVLSDQAAVAPSFVTPPVDGSGGVLTFSLIVTDAAGLESEPDRVDVVVADNGIAGFPLDTHTFRSATGREMAIATDANGALTALYPRSDGVVTDTENRPTDFPYGLFDLEIIPEMAGGNVGLVVYLPEAAPEGYGWYKYRDGLGWNDYRDHAVFNHDRTMVFLTFADGGVEDDDGAVNGVIVDLSGLGTLSGTRTGSDDGGDGNSDGAEGSGGGGGCFIRLLTETVFR
ncbi:MAG: hypothetical protein CSA22_09035 [Deltaproteobacteria bacterium]|nr:MAG: hypothetical protein CSA22_09035 [Deltaproteobacteria bacterium]